LPDSCNSFAPQKGKIMKSLALFGILVFGLQGGAFAAARNHHFDYPREESRYAVKDLVIQISIESESLLDLLTNYPDADWTGSVALRDLHRFVNSARQFSFVLGQDYGDPTYEIEAYNDLIKDYNQFRMSFPPGGKDLKDSVFSQRYANLHQLMLALVQGYAY